MNQQAAAPSSAQGLFVYADSYFMAAKTLAHSDTSWPHGDAPSRLLLFHAVELYLKAFLIANGFSSADMAKKPMSHNLGHIAKTCIEYGLPISNADITNLVDAASSNATMQSRYLAPSAPGKIIFELKLLDGMAQRIRSAITNHPSRQGHIVIWGEGVT